jgi:hypothetical protein
VTSTRVAILQIVTGPIVFTRVTQTFIDIGAAVGPCPAGSTLAAVVPWRQLVACSSLVARVLRTSVDGRFAEGSGEPLGTFAEVSVVGVETRGAIEAGVAFALIDIDLAVCPSEPRCACAGVAVSSLVTGAAVETRHTLTWIGR